VWAQVTPLAARRDVEADADGVTQAYRIVLRSHLSLTLQHRFSDGARIIALSRSGSVRTAASSRSMRMCGFRESTNVILRSSRLRRASKDGAGHSSFEARKARPQDDDIA
jgi:hypothetical protein